MDNKQVNLEGVSARLARLERSNWRLRLGLAACLCGFAALGLMGATAGVPRVIRAQRFVVVSPDGTQVDSFGLGSHGGYNSLEIGAQLEQSLTLSEGGLFLVSRSGAKFGVVALNPDGLTMAGPLGLISLSDGNVVPLLLPRSVPPGPVLRMQGNNLNDNVTVSLAGPSPAISLADSAGFSMTLGGASLVTEATGETHQTSATSIVMFGNDKKHHVIWQAPNH